MTLEHKHGTSADGDHQRQPPPPKSAGGPQLVYGGPQKCDLVGGEAQRNYCSFEKHTPIPLSHMFLPEQPLLSSHTKDTLKMHKPHTKDVH